MLAVEKLKQPKVIKYVWWDGFGRLQGVIAWSEPKFEE